MTTTTATTYGAEFSQQEQADGILAYINGGDYTQQQQTALAGAMMAALGEEVDRLLPNDVSWHPATSEFVHPVDSDSLPDREAMTDLFHRAWEALEGRFDAIEREALA